MARLAQRSDFALKAHDPEKLNDDDKSQHHGTQDKGFFQSRPPGIAFFQGFLLLFIGRIGITLGQFVRRRQGDDAAAYQFWKLQWRDLSYMYHHVYMH